MILAISAFAALQAYGGDMAVASMRILSSVMQFVMLLLPGLVQGVQVACQYSFVALDQAPKAIFLTI